jgi:hypothetical protein
MEINVCNIGILSNLYRLSASNLGMYAFKATKVA